MQTAQKVTLAALAMVLAGAVTVQAQTNNASIAVSATVQQPINVTAANALSFGNVLPGVNSTVAVTDANAGRFDVTGQASTPVSMTFVLPLNLADGVGNLLPIGTWTGVWSNGAAPSPVGTSFTPSAGATAATLGASSNLFVYAGATVSPAVNQVAGLYNGTVQMTVVY